MDYLDFDLEIGTGSGRDYPISVRSPAGEANERMHFPYDEVALELALVKLQNALLRSGGPTRRALTPEEQAVSDFGRTLFEALMTGEVRSRYAVSRDRANKEEKGLRLRLHVTSPELAALPWEYLYDQSDGEYLCLSRTTPLVRYLNLPRSHEPLTVAPPLRILGLVASPDHPSVARLNTEVEQRRLEQALGGLTKRGLVELHWLEGHTWRDLHQAMWPGSGPWHMLHFIGHGGFNEQTEEGLLALETDEGGLHLLSARQLGRVLKDHYSLRLVLLNACEGARGSTRDRFSSVGATLARAGIPAVLAMQYEITDRAALELTRTFYEALAGGLPVDAALTEARLAINIGVTNSLEWGTPVLFLRTPDGLLFHLSKATPMPATATEPSSETVTETGEVAAEAVAGVGEPVAVAADAPAAKEQAEAAAEAEPQLAEAIEEGEPEAEAEAAIDAEAAEGTEMVAVEEASQVGVQEAGVQAEAAEEAAAEAEPQTAEEEAGIETEVEAVEEAAPEAPTEQAKAAVPPEEQAEDEAEAEAQLAKERARAEAEAGSAPEAVAEIEENARAETVAEIGETAPKEPSPANTYQLRGRQNIRQVDDREPKKRATAIRYLQEMPGQNIQQEDREPEKPSPANTYQQFRRDKLDSSAFSVGSGELLLLGGPGTLVGVLTQSWPWAVGTVAALFLLAYALGYRKALSLLPLSIIGLVSGALVYGIIVLLASSPYDQVQTSHLWFNAVRMLTLRHQISAGMWIGVFISLLASLFTFVSKNPEDGLGDVIFGTATFGLVAGGIVWLIVISLGSIFDWGFGFGYGWDFNLLYGFVVAFLAVIGVIGLLFVWIRALTH